MPSLRRSEGSLSLIHKTTSSRVEASHREFALSLRKLLGSCALRMSFQAQIVEDESCAGKCRNIRLVVRRRYLDQIHADEIHCSEIAQDRECLMGREPARHGSA